MKNEPKHDSMTALADAIDELKKEQGSRFSLDKINLAELERRTGISRGKLRGLKKNGFRETPPGEIRRRPSKLDGYTGILDSLLKDGVSNSTVCLNRLKANGFTGGQTIVKEYIAAHRNLIPARRESVAPQGKRAIRYSDSPGEVFQMDWGFTEVLTSDGQRCTAACFAMICHACGQRYIEFFPNARQENLFIGMIHAFCYMGVPEFVMTDNMKSVVIRRDLDGRPIWQKDYEAFMRTAGFQTRLCKPRHPYTKGAVERLVRFVKDNFLAGRTFRDITDLNRSALEWCNEQNRLYHRSMDAVPQDIHMRECAGNLHELEQSEAVRLYLCPERRISFDGFVNYEGRRYGVPYRYPGSSARVMRREDMLYLYSDDLTTLLAVHRIEKSRRDSFCEDQYALPQPEEHPTVPVQTQVLQLPEAEKNLSFDKFDFDRK